MQSKSKEEVVLYGRTAEQNYSLNYQRAEILLQILVWVLVQIAKEIMHAVASYSRFCATLPCKAEKKWEMQLPKEGWEVWCPARFLHKNLV
jgi:hypothetical protein